MPPKRPLASGNGTSSCYWGVAPVRTVRQFWQQPSFRYGSIGFAVLALALLLASHTAQGMIGRFARDTAAMLDARSPGARGNGALVQTKLPRHRVASAPRAPRSRVLSGERTRPSLPGLPAQEAPIDEALPQALSGLPIGPEELGGVPGGGGAQPLASAVPVPIGGAPLPIGGGGTTPPGGDTTVPAVPEPDTYALLGLGIGLIGATQRRRRLRGARGRQGSASAPLPRR